MKQNIYNHIGLLFGYTLFYHGLYYCPKMNATFESFIKKIHFINKIE